MSATTSTSDSLASDINLMETLFSYVESKRLDIKLKALETLKVYSENESFQQFAIQNPKRILAALTKRSGLDIEHMHDSLDICVNLCPLQSLFDEMLAYRIVDWVMNILFEQLKVKEPMPIDFLLRMLFNLTRVKKGVDQLVQLGHDTREGQYVTMLMEFLSRPVQPISNETHCDRYQRIADIMFNICYFAKPFLLKQNVSFYNLLSRQLLVPTRQLTILKCFSWLSQDPEFHLLFSESDCEIVLRIACWVYPPLNDPRRQVPLQHQNMTGSLIVNQTVKPCHLKKPLSSDPLHSDSMPDTTGSGILRPVHPFINMHANGFIQDYECKELISEFFGGLCRTAIGRETLRKQEIYEVLRCWHIYEENKEIQNSIENIVPLIVYSETELQEQQCEIQT